MHLAKRAAIATAHRYSVIVSVFSSVERIPEMASGIIVESRPGPVLVTAAHVLARFLSLGPNGRLQIGAHRFTLQSVSPTLIHFDRALDIATLALEPADLEPIGKEALPLSQIASTSVTEGTLVAFVGYPGQWKQPGKCEEVSLGYYEFFGPVRTVEPDQFSLLIDSTYEIRITTTRPNFSLGETESLGGLSGAPIFSAVELPLLVGWIHEGQLFSATDHKLFAVHATRLGLWVSDIRS
jgi:hypothetical protein